MLNFPSLKDQLLEHNYTIEKELRTTPTEQRCIIVKDENKFYAKIVSLKEFFKSNELANIWNNEIQMAILMTGEMPQMVQFYESFRTCSYLFVIYYYIKHETLQEYIEKRTLNTYE